MLMVIPMNFYYTTEQLNNLKNKDKKLAAYIEKVGLIEREINPNLFEALIDSIISQQISTKAAITIKNRIIDISGSLNANDLSLLTIEQIQACGMSFRKANYIQNAVNAYLNKEIDFDLLPTMSDQEIIDTLVKLPGIGTWTVEMLLIFSLNRYDVISYKDLGIIRGMKRLYNKDEITKEQFAKYKKRYSPYGSIASLYLWYISK